MSELTPSPQESPSVLDHLPIPRGQLTAQQRRELSVALLTRDKDTLRKYLSGTFHADIVGSDGQVRDSFEWQNIVTDEGLDHLLDAALSGATQITTWYLLLKDNTGDPLDGTETYATPVFTEITDYDEANRVTWVDGGVSGQSVSNTASPGSFSINATVTVHGAALVGGGSAPQTKSNAAGGGTMYAAGNFPSAKAMSAGETLQITYTFTAADDGV